MASIRPPAVAGTFYPADPGQLRQQVENLLAAARPQALPRQPKALIVPHAGYLYSGATAALAYALLLPWRSRITRVVLLGPSHRVPLQGLALPPWSSFASPLGSVPLDQSAQERLQDLPQVASAINPTSWNTPWKCSSPSCNASWTSSSCCPWWWARPMQKPWPRSWTGSGAGRKPWWW